MTEVSDTMILMWKDYNPSAVMQVRSRTRPGCYLCELQDICKARLANKLWLACEIPDQRDFRRVGVNLSTFNEELLSYRLTAEGFEQIPVVIQHAFA